MKEIAISLNLTESRKNKFLVLDTYIAKGRINNCGKYVGGSISPVEFELLNDETREFMASNCVRIGKNSYYISIDSYKNIVDDFNDKYLFLIDNPDHTMYFVKNIIMTSPAKSIKPIHRIGEHNLSYSKDNILFIEKDVTVSVSAHIERPSTLIKFDEKNKVYELWFDYGGVKKAFSDKTFSVFSGNKLYVVNFDFELVTSEKMVKMGFTRLAKGRFIYSGTLNKVDLITKLRLQEIAFEEDKNVILPKISLKSSDSDWFDFDLTCQVDGEMVDLASKINLFASKNEIVVDGKKIILPESIALAREAEGVTFENNKIKIHKSSIFHLLRIFYEAGIDNDKFFSFSNIELCIPKELRERAFSYQIEGIKWLKFLFLNKLGGCLADDMGLGKTFQTIAFLSEKEIRKQIQKVLIVVPKSLLTNWKKEFEKFSSEYSMGIYHGEKRKEFNFKKYDVVITTYATASLDVEILNKENFTVAIYDEIQCIKNHKALTSEKMKRIKASIKLGLSGTPMENNISELWNVMDVLNPGIFGSHSSFLLRYRDKNRDELKQILNLFILRRMKKNVLTQLPEKQEQIIYCDMDSEQRMLYNSINYAVKSAIASMRIFSSAVVLKGLLYLRQCCCHTKLLNLEVNPKQIDESCKIEALKILVENSISCNRKILIFSQFTSMLNLIYNELTQYKDILFYLDGQTQNREEIVDDFEKSQKGIFLISIKAGGVGLNLTTAEDVVIYDPWWNPFVEQQAVDRAYRIGQKNKVNVYKLVAANTIEEKIVEMQNEKWDEFNDIINGISEDKNIDIRQILKLL